MKSVSIPPVSLALALAFAVCPAAVVAQAVVQPLPGTTDADALAAVMRRVAANPQDVTALVEAGELSLKVDDLSGAASLFARADKISPGNGRVKAGMASILVRAERPGEALRYFGQAEMAGTPASAFAADRGLAYDLIGQQERAQRDYRLALRTTPNDDETIRRYALSLGISGRKDLALEQLVPLLRRTDRGAWRARAFILAMNGDQAEANRIATTMMPPGMSAGLVPFLQRLPGLPAIDRAFAVHFGEVRATPERLADARMVPPLGVLGPDPFAPVQVAAVTKPAPQPDPKRKKSRKERKEEERALAAARRAPPVQLAMVQPLPQPPAYGASAYPAPSTVQPATTTPSTPVPAVTRPPVALASRSSTYTPASSSLRTSVTPTTGAATTAPSSSSIAPALTPGRTPTASVTAPSAGTTSVPSYPGEAPVRTAAVPAPTTPTQTASVPPTLPKPAASGLATPSPFVAAKSPSPSSTATAITSPPASTALAGTATTRPMPTPPAVGTAPVRTAVTTSPPPAARASEDSILARIVASLSIPASELGVQQPVRAVAVPVVPDAALAEARATAADDAADKKAAVDKIAAERLAEAEAKERADKRADAKKAAADKKALAEKKAAADKKALADKEAAEKKKAAKADPARIWVQVAGGAYEGDLPKAYAAVKAKAPETFGSRGGWSTPLRATNRVLTGPFKTDAEARAFVNALAKKGVSAFTFSSEVGQKITKLPAK